MILCDTHVWLALTLDKHNHHSAAVDWFDQQVAAASVWFCRSTQQSYLRLLSSSKLLGAFGNEPLTNEQAWQVYSKLLGDYRIVLKPEPPGLDAWWTFYGVRDSASPKLWMDAYLAAFAKAGGLELATLDRGFRNFEGLDLCLLGTA